MQDEDGEQPHILWNRISQCGGCSSDVNVERLSNGSIRVHPGENCRDKADCVRRFASKCHPAKVAYPWKQFSRPPRTADGDDNGIPALDDLKFLARQLRQANPKPQRHRGKKGDALRDLTEIEERLEKGDLSARDLIEIEVQLERLRGSTYFGEGPLGAERFFRPAKRRPKGVSTNSKLDWQILVQAIKITPQKGSLGAALRQLVQEYMTDGRLPKCDGQTHIKRLRRLEKRRRKDIGDLRLAKWKVLATN